MVYTVKKLSQLSGVTVRTLHYYEEEGLLKPAYYGSNSYRYYGERELLQLQQILFYKELGFTIRQIKDIVGKDDFNQLSALYSHRKSLIQESKKIGQLLETVDKTIKHLRGKKRMKDQEIFDGFNISLLQKAKADTSYSDTEEILLKSVRSPTKNSEDVEKRGKGYYQDLTIRAHVIFNELVQCLEKGLKPNSSEVQSIIQKHHTFTDQIQNANQEVYLAMAQLYLEHPEFRKQLDPFHPKLAEFMSEGMAIFANQELK